MGQGNKKFTERLREAANQVQCKLSLISPVSGSLFSPVPRNNKFEWVKVMDSDGLLLRKCPVSNGEGRAPRSPVDLLMGVVIQSEDATSQTKPNPMGKAAIGHVRSGIWVDVTTTERRRIDRLLVVFVLPEGATSSDKNKFATAQRNVQNAADLMPDVQTIQVKRGSNACILAGALKKVVTAFFQL